MAKSNLKVGLITTFVSIVIAIGIIIGMMVFYINFGPGGNVENVEFDYGLSKKFSNEEIEAAMKAVKVRFSHGNAFEYCKLLSLTYKEDKSNYYIDNILSKEKFNQDPNNIIVLFCKFDSGNSDSKWSGSSFPSNTINSSYEWALTRADKDSPWEVTGSGML